MSIGTWTITTTKWDVSGTDTVTVQTISRYTTSIHIEPPKPTDLTGTYWRWDSYTTSTSEDPTYYNLEINTKSGIDNNPSIGNTNYFYIPFSTNGGTKYYALRIGNGTVASNLYIGQLFSDSWGYTDYRSGSSGWVRDIKSDGCQYFKVISGQVKNSNIINYLYAHATQCDSNWNPF